MKDNPYVVGVWISSRSLATGDFSPDPEKLQKWSETYGRSVSSMDESRPFGYSSSRAIPDEYIFNTVSIRRELLAGILDAGSVAKKSHVELTFYDEKISSQVAFLCRSLGFTVKLCVVSDLGEKSGSSTLLKVEGNFAAIPTSLVNLNEISVHGETSSVEIIAAGFGDYFGWEIDGNKRFVLGDFTVTHNTGKTCSAVGAIEKVKHEGRFKGALIIAPGDNLLDNFRVEIATKCTSGQYIPAEYTLEEFKEPGKKGEKMRKLRHLLKKEFYRFTTYRKLAKFLEKIEVKNIDRDDPNYEEKRYRNIRDRYSDMIIVMDEVHHIRPKDNPDKETMKTYEMMHRLCHVTQNRKVVLMSGTPMFRYFYLKK